MTVSDIFFHLLKSLIREGSRYFIAAGIAYFIFYFWKKQKYSWRKIQKTSTSKAQIAREILYSLSTVFIFGMVGLVIFFAKRSGHTFIYTDIAKYGYVFLVCSFFIAILMHDAYFYWMHRAIHHNKVFKFIHKTHHLSKNPTPWAAYAFHPFEAFLEAGIFPVLVFLVPFHPVVLLSFMVWQIYFNVGGHLGYEIYPKRFMQSGWSKLFNSSTHHNMHHSKFKGNYGLYFRFWDKWMGTEFKDYEATYNSVVNKENELEFTPAEEVFARIDRQCGNKAISQNSVSTNI